MDGVQDSRQIGALAQKIGSSLRISDSIPKQQQTNSGTTGALYRGPRGESSTGRELSAIAAASLPAVVAAMRAGSVDQTDKALMASLPRSVASALRPEIRDFIDPVYGSDFELVGYRIAGRPPADDIDVAKEMVGFCLSGAPENAIKAELARLRVSTKARAESDDDLVMGFQVYAEECAQYPADVVSEALRTLARIDKFYPSLSELREMLSRKARIRQSLKRALEGL